MQWSNFFPTHLWSLFILNIIQCLNGFILIFFVRCMTDMSGDNELDNEEQLHVPLVKEQIER